MSELIDVLLAESDFHDDILLRHLLDDIEREATRVRPMPSAELSELMSPRATAAGGASSRRTARRSSFAGRGAVITGVVVIGVLGLGAGAAAANPEARSAIGAGASAIAHLFNPDSAVPTSTDGSTLSPVIGGSHDRSGGPASRGETEADHASSHQRDGSEHGNDSNSGSGSSGSGSSGSESSGSGSSGSGSSDSSEHSGDSNSGDSNSGDSNGDGSGKDSGGNQSGHGGNSGKGNGGPAPTK